MKDGEPLFTVANAEVYGEWLGKRYHDAGLIWILGGDRSVDNDGQREIIRATARRDRSAPSRTTACGNLCRRTMGRCSTGCSCSMMPRSIPPIQEFHDEVAFPGNRHWPEDPTWILKANHGGNGNEASNRWIGYNQARERLDGFRRCHLLFCA